MATRNRKHSVVRVNMREFDRAFDRKFQRNISHLAEAADISRPTIYDLYDQQSVRRATLVALADAFEISVDDLLAAGTDGQVALPTYSLPSTEEWQVDDSVPCSPWLKLSNKLDLRICRMRRKSIEGDFGRGKFYDLLSFPRDQREDMKHILIRHAVVASTLPATPYISPLYSCVPCEHAGWWVIERWVDGASLEEHLTSGAWPRKTLPWLMKEILNGLSVLHSHNIVMRELTPARVLIPAAGGLPVLTDFELAKLLNGAPTVKTGLWPENPFRADEVEEGEVTPSADLYSWAMLLLNAATGKVPDVRSLKQVVLAADLPKDVTVVVRECLAAPSRRPKTCDDVLKRLRKWK